MYGVLNEKARQETVWRVPSLDLHLFLMLAGGYMLQIVWGRKANGVINHCDADGDDDGDDDDDDLFLWVFYLFCNQ